MTQSLTLFTIAIALACAIVLFFAIDKLFESTPPGRGGFESTPPGRGGFESTPPGRESSKSTRRGWIAVSVIVCLLPLLATTSGAAYAVKTSSSTAFCLECHEMGDYGRSLFIDDKRVLPAVHYQNRLVDRDQVCFTCHTDYAMWGDVKAKLNGLKHVWVHYLGEIPDQFELYQPYPNHNCLHCHEDARSYVEVAAHASKLEALTAGEQSCLDCHGGGHALAQVEEGNLWLGP